MTARRCPRGVLWVAVALLAGLLAGCAGAGASRSRVADPTVGRAQALAYAHAVNLRLRDLPGYAGAASEVEDPEPGRYGLDYERCTGAVSAVHRIAKMSSPEFSAGRSFDSKLVKSTVEVWPTPAIVARDNARSHSIRGRACLVRFIVAVNRKINRERKGQMLIGPFTITSVHTPLPGVADGFQTRIDETRLRRSGAVFFHVYRDILGFVSGPAEIELEAIGFVHPVPAATEKQALRTLLERATANAGELRP